jgi:hypothetical protein
MQFFRPKLRSWEAYVAGIGASGALLAGGIAIFVIMIGVVTFRTWPHAGALLGDGGGDIPLQGTAQPPPGPPSTPNLSGPVGGGAGSASSAPAGSARGGTRAIRKTLPGGDAEAPGGLGSGGGRPQAAEPPPSAPAQPQGVLAEAASGVGSTVQKETQSLGDTVNSQTGTNLGDGVTGLGDTLNDNLRALAGNP